MILHLNLAELSEHNYERLVVAAGLPSPCCEPRYEPLMRWLRVGDSRFLILDQVPGWTALFHLFRCPVPRRMTAQVRRIEQLMDAAHPLPGKGTMSTFI